MYLGSMFYDPGKMLRQYFYRPGILVFKALKQDRI
jgi:hypothetical protein